MIWLNRRTFRHWPSGLVLKHDAIPVRVLLGVLLFLATVLAIFELSGLRDHFGLKFLKGRILDNEFTGLVIFVLLFSLGNLIQIPGWIFLAAAVLTLGEVMTTLQVECDD